MTKEETPPAVEWLVVTGNTVLLRTPDSGEACRYIYDQGLPVTSLFRSSPVAKMVHEANNRPHLT